MGGALVLGAARWIRGALVLAGAACTLAALWHPANLFARARGPGPPRVGSASAKPPAPAVRTAAGNACALVKLRLRCPDLVMSAPFDLQLDRTSIRGHVLLRAASSLSNLGRGPLELRAHRRGTGPFIAEQAIYDTHDARHVFATRAQLVFKFVPGYRYGHPSIGNYSYWKVRHVASFELWSIDARFHAVRLVRSGPKVDYCLRDLIRTHRSGRSPVNPVYPACSQNPNLREDVLGVSVGWSDVYPYEYPQQWIDVTALRGRFAFVMVADPLGLLQESDEQNNVSETYVELPSGRVLGHRVGVATP